MPESPLLTADKWLIAVLASMGGLALIGLALFLATWSDDFQSSRLRLTDAFDRMRELAGPGAVDCGHVKVGADAAPAIGCVEQAMRDGRPFWMARENSFSPQDAMEFHWFGFTRDQQGRQNKVIFYPPNTTGSHGILKVLGCPRIELHMDNGDVGPTCIVRHDGKRYESPHFWYLPPSRDGSPR
jgi:hypothetical protein